MMRFVSLCRAQGWGVHVHGEVEAAARLKDEFVSVTVKYLSPS